MYYKLRPNKVLRKEKSIPLAQLLMGEQDPSSFKRAVFRKKPSYRCVKVEDTALLPPLVDRNWHNLKRLCCQYLPYKDVQYKEYRIPKRSGGFRLIEEPYPSLKYLQRSVVRILEDIGGTSHTAAYGYVKGRGTLGAVQKHQRAGSRWFLKVDIHDFFGSCTPAFVEQMLARITPFNKLVTEGIEHSAFSVCFRHDRLPQGAPSSPIITNMLMIPFDHELSVWARKYGLLYTRYADDLLISGREGFDYNEVIGQIESLFRQFEMPFTLNKKKTRYGNINGRNWNLGLMLNKDNDITVGYRNKKRLKAMLCNIASNAQTNPASKEERNKILGILSYHQSIDKGYTDYLVSKCSEKWQIDVMQFLKS